MTFKNAFYLPSGRVFLLDCDGYLIECTEMRDVAIGGKENYEVRNSMDPHVIWRHLKPYEEKWLLTVSTQKGCPHACHFCDVAGLPFDGDLTAAEMEEQIRFILNATPYVKTSNKVKIGFARMGEPSHNIDNVLEVINNLDHISCDMGRNYKWLPCFNSILPRKTTKGISGFDVIDQVLETKVRRDGYLHFQISVNSTDEDKRRELFAGADVLTLKEVISHINKSDIPLGNRTVTLNFIVMDGVEVDVNKLERLGLNGEKFTVKLIPLNNTIRSQTKHLNTYANYSNYETLESLGEKFNSIGVPTVIDAIAKCEEAGLCCGQLAQIFNK